MHEASEHDTCKLRGVVNGSVPSIKRTSLGRLDDQVATFRARCGHCVNQSCSPPNYFTATPAPPSRRERITPELGDDGDGGDGYDL